MNKIISATNLTLMLVLFFLITQQMPDNKEIEVRDQKVMSRDNISIRKNVDKSWVITFPQHMIESQEVLSSLSKDLLKISLQCEIDTIWISSDELAMRPVNGLKNATASTPPYKSYDAYISCDRGVIRPGGELHANFIIRVIKSFNACINYTF